MKTCTECGSKIKFGNKARSIFTRHGVITCDSCNSKFKLNRGTFRIIYDTIMTFAAIGLSEVIGGYKGVFIATVIMLLVTILEVETISKYTLINE